MSEEPGAAHCTTCGLPISEPACRACGGTSEPILLADGIASASSAFAPDPGRPELDLAYDAFNRGDYARVVSHCLAAEGINDARMQQTAEGPTFQAMIRGLSTFLRVVSHASTGELVIEVPVVRLPLTQYVPSLRLLLELSDRDAIPTRFSVRGDLVMARFVGRLATMTPASLTTVLKAVVSAASDCARLLVGALQAQEISADEHRSLTFDALPRAVALADSLPSSSSPMPKKAPARPVDASFVDHAPPYEPPIRPTPVVEIPAILMPPGGVSAQAPARGKVPTPARIGRPTPGFIPTGAGARLSRPPDPFAAAARAPSVPPGPGIGSGNAPSIGPGNAPGSPRLMPPPRSSASSPPPPIGRTMVSAEGAAPTEPSAGLGYGTPAPAQTDPLGDTFISHGHPVPPAKTGSPADGLCELMHKAQTLGAVLSFADQPATMCLLIRASVYRAIQEHEQAAPRAVALLFHSTVAMTKEIYITAPGKRRGSMAIPPTSPAFEVMARIVAQRGDVESPEPLRVQPITTAQEAKQHLARYVSEIDQAPSDTDLRHFLALGALCELLVRTKLPAPTQDRLRGIVTHARKEGGKQPVVDLMMTALTRMIA